LTIEYCHDRTGTEGKVQTILIENNKNGGFNAKYNIW
jgi:hypothetical protein